HSAARGKRAPAPSPCRRDRQPTTNNQQPLFATLLEMSETENTQAGDSLGRHGLPPATFDFLILSLRAQAEMQMGLCHFGDEAEKPEPDFDLATHSTDMRNVLLDKPKANLTLD